MYTIKHIQVKNFGKRFKTASFRLKTCFELKIGKLLNIRMYILRDRQSLSERDMALMTPIYK